MSPEPPMLEIMPDAISWISAIAWFMRMSLIAPFRLSIFALRGLHGDIARLDQVLVGRLGLLELLAVLLELRVDGLQPQRVLAGRRLVAGAQVRGGLGAQVLLLGFELAHLAHDAFAQPGVRGEALVEVGDLLAQVLLLELQQGLRIALLDAGDEEREEPFDEIRDPAEHAPSAVASLKLDFDGRRA